MRALSKTAPALEGVGPVFRVTVWFFHGNRTGIQEGFPPAFGAVLPIARTSCEFNGECGFTYHQSLEMSGLLVPRPALFPAPAADRQNRPRNQAHGKNSKVNQRRRRVDRGLFRGARDRKVKVDGLRIVHADVEHDKEDNKERDGFDDGFEHGGERFSPTA